MFSQMFWINDDDGLRYYQGQMKLKTIINKFQFPLVIQSDLGFLQEKRLDLSQPLFAYCQRSVRKVSARNVEWENNDPTGFHFVGHDLLIPEDYTGWFAVLEKPAKQPSSPYRSVSDLNQSKWSTFLVAGITPVKAYVMTLTKTSCRHTPHQLLPGDIIIKGNNRVLKEGSAELEALYAQHSDCRGASAFAVFFDEKGRGVVLRTEQGGVFYPVYQKDMKPPDGKTLAIQLVDIIEKNVLPVMVKLLHGWVPAMQSGFTGTLHLQDVAHESTVVASTFFREVVVSLEIPVDSETQFRVAETTSELKASQEWVDALRHCKANAPNYTKAMKVIGPPGLVDIDESCLDLPDQKSSDQTEVKTFYPHQPTSRNCACNMQNHDAVQLRRTNSGATNKSPDLSSRVSTVNCLSKRVGVYAMDQSFSSRDFTMRRKARHNAFRNGKMGLQRPITIPQTVTKSNLYTTIASADEHSSDGTALPISVKHGRPEGPHMPDGITPCSGNTDTGDSFVSPLYPLRRSPGGLEEATVDAAFPLRRTRSQVVHLLENNNCIISISPRTYEEETREVDAEDSGETDDSEPTLYLFHGSIPNPDDEYITPTGGPLNKEPRTPKSPIPPNDSFPPPLPPRRRPPLANRATGCYNKDMLIEELKNAVPISATEELALKSLTLADFTALLWNPQATLEGILMSLLPEIGHLNLKNIAMYFSFLRDKVRTFTEI